MKLKLFCQFGFNYYIYALSQDYSMKKIKLKENPNYLACTDGFIYSSNFNNTQKEKPLKGTGNGLGYLRVVINKKYRYVHRIIAESFIPNPFNKKTVNHINGIKSDNRVENLEWATYSENIIHGYELGLQKKRFGELSNLSKLTRSDIDEIFKMRIDGFSQTFIAEKFKVNQSTITRILNKKTWK